MRSSELRIMALRQRQQIDKQQQLLAAREQRLRFLKTQEANETAVTAESERLRRLRERVEAQESKLRRLRALRGQVDFQKTYNVTLGNDLDSIRALFNEKEKELTVAVAKVEALTRQLEDLRRDRRGNLNYFSSLPNHCGLNNSSAAIELDNLRSELMYRNQLSLQQDARLHLQRDALQKRQVELQSVDQRILELQGRLNKKRSSHINSIQPAKVTSISNAGNHFRSVSSSFHSTQNKGPRCNVVAVGPFNHFPEKIVTQGTIRNKANVLNNTNKDSMSNTYPSLIIVNNDSRYSRKISTEDLGKTLDTEYSMAPESDEHKLAAKHNKMSELNKKQNYEFVKTPSTSEIIHTESTSAIEHESIFIVQNFENDETLTIQKTSSLIEQKKNQLTSTYKSDVQNEYNSNKGCDSSPPVKTPVHSTPLMANRSISIPMASSQTTISNNQAVFLEPPYFYPKNILSDKSELPANCIDIMNQSKPTDKLNMESMEKLKPTLPPKPLKSIPVLPESETSSEIKSSHAELSIQNMVCLSKANGSIMPDSLPIKARPLTIKKSPYSEHPRLKNNNSGNQKNSILGTHRTCDMSHTYNLSDQEKPEDIKSEKMSQLCIHISESDKLNRQSTSDEKEHIAVDMERAEESKNAWKDETARRKRSFVSSAATEGNFKFARRVSFDPLALLLDASLEGELQLVKITATQDL